MTPKTRHQPHGYYLGVEDEPLTAFELLSGIVFGILFGLFMVGAIVLFYAAVG